MWAYEYFMGVAIIGSIFLILPSFGTEMSLPFDFDGDMRVDEWSEGKPWLLILMMIFPWLWLFLEELTAPFITYTPSMLINMFTVETLIRFYYADYLEVWMITVWADAIYKYFLYEMYKAPEDSFQLV